MSSRIPQQLNEYVLQHLQNEEAVLLQMKTFAASLTAEGFQVRSLIESQSGLTALLDHVVQIQEQRQQFCQALGQLLGCSPSVIRLSELDLGTPVANEQFHRRREKLIDLAIATRTCLSTADQTLRGWSGIINFVLGELLGPNANSDRYTATGQKMASTRAYSIDVRS